VKVGHFVRFDVTDVATWIDGQKVTGRIANAHPLATIAVEPQIAPTAILNRRPTSATEVLARWKSASG